MGAVTSGWEGREEKVSVVVVEDISSAVCSIKFDVDEDSAYLEYFEGQLKKTIFVQRDRQ